MNITSSFLIAFLVLMLFPIAVLPQSNPDFAERKNLFTYDDSLPLGINIQNEEEKDGVIIKDITFQGHPEWEPIEAYLVIPPDNDSSAGILWGHWLGHHTSDREQYLDEAVKLANRGVVSLLINTMWAKPRWYQERDLEDDYSSSIRQVISFRRAMDLLLDQEGVDKDRIAFVGHDYSGMYGSIASGIDQRATTHVFIAVTSSLSDWAFFVNQPKSKVAYLRKNAVFELTDYISQIKGSVFCQFALNDPYISKTDGNVFYNAITSENKERKRYDSEHFMEGDDILKDRTNWLIKELGLK